MTSATDTPPQDATEHSQAGWAYVWYLLNISFLPGLGFLMLLLLWQRSRKRCQVFANAHARQGIIASILAGILLTVVSTAIVLVGGLSSPYTWVILILYFTLCHSALIILGIVGYARSSAGKRFEILHFSTWRGD